MDARPSHRRTPGHADRHGSARASGGRHAGSIDLLLELSHDPAVQELLAEFGVHTPALLERRGSVRRELEPEPADWRVRLAQRGAGKLGVSELDRLLAIVRSADCHAYQLLERSGVACGQLRKRIIERLRERGTAVMHRPDQVGVGARPRSRATSGAPALPSRLRQRTPERAPADKRPDTTADVVNVQEEPREAPEPRSQPGRRAARRQAIDPETLPPLVGREAELARLADAVLRHAPRPPVLVGAHGSGRTLTARHLARMVRAPVFHLLATDYESDEALRADFEDIERQRGVAILDELDRVASDAPPEFLATLSQAWARGTPPVLTILSHENLARLAAWLPGAHETLDILALPEASPEAHVAAVTAAAPRVLEQHGLPLARGAHPGELARLADRYLAGLAMPGRALDLLDLSCARALREGLGAGVTRELWIDIVCERTGLPRERVEGREDRAMLDLEVQLARRVVGHASALETLARLIRRNRAGFRCERPVATALLLGPSGVGKTEIAKALCVALFDRPGALVRLDMSEYAESHAVARIIGAPPGYVGHEHGGALTDPLLRAPHCVVLLDEIEKAHRDVHQLLLQVFDEGRLTDGRGRTVDFRHAIIIMTSNLGSDELATAPKSRTRTRAKSRSRGDAPDAAAVDELATATQSRTRSPAKSRSRGDAPGYTTLEQRVLAAARAAFPVELWNRIEAPLLLHPLTRAELTRVCHRLARTSSERLFAERGIRYRLSEAACARLVDLCGQDAALGARPLRHLLSRQIEAMIAESILRGRVRAGTQLEIQLEDGEWRLVPLRHV